MTRTRKYVPLTEVKLALIDLDGVICDDRHRVHHAINRQWPSYFDKMHADAVWAEGRELVERLVAEGYELVYLTGRREDTRRMTVKWLDEHGFPLRAVMMRAYADRRPLAQMKADVIGSLKDSGQWPGGITLYDDDPSVIEEVQSRFGPEAAVHCTWHVKPMRLIRRDKDNDWDRPVGTGAGR